MQAKTLILSLAIAGLFAATGAVFAHGPGPQGGGMGYGPRGAAPLDPAQQAERMQARLGGLKDALKLQPGQMDAWNAYEAKVKSEAQARTQMRQGMLDLRNDSQAMADYRVTMMKHNAQAAEEVNGLRKALVATLTPEQKATFDQYAPGPPFVGIAEPTQEADLAAAAFKKLDGMAEAFPVGNAKQDRPVTCLDESAVMESKQIPNVIALLARHKVWLQRGAREWRGFGSDGPGG